jgi:CRP-like cAMP-binding protein
LIIKYATTDLDNMNETPEDRVLKTNEEIDEFLGVDDLDTVDAEFSGTKKGMIIEAGRSIIEQGQPSHHAYYIEYGKAEVIVEEEGHAMVLGEIGPGEVFGEMGVIEKMPRGASVKAVEKSRVILLTKKDIEERLEQLGDPMVKSMLDTLVKRLRHANVGQFSNYKKLNTFQDRVSGIG